MKNLFFFITISILAFTLNSCSKDDINPSTNVLKCKVNGVQKNFFTIAISSYGSIFVSGYVGTLTDQTENLSFNIKPNISTSEALLGIEYAHIGDVFTFSDDLIFTINENNSDTNTLKGTFSGTIKNIHDNSTKTITEGVFDLKY